MRTAIILTLLLLTACTAPEPTPTPPQPTTTSQPPPTGLVIRPAYTDAAMGIRVLDIHLTNYGPDTTQINGYPDIRILDKDRQPITATIGHGSSDISTMDAAFNAPPQPLTLEPGQSARVGLLWRNLVTEPDRTATHGVYLDIAPTLGATYQRIEPDGGIDLGNTTKLGLSAWTKLTQ
ncbi:DUF4232 domain-containing protein [Kibdelosporangium philippinense]|uniref:DUF4232 domain-containing protein n=1 Tax=Kibdelosporangium philippinense TaxID=211113 RepID=A0ABS8Z987_9PSEU|nr:DUF4232 domain-containing protein [Kibdelosporangium philippinense]MCE7004097.1 DUF4232 domain-containing protein [Kibdelosporangium philippinense]